MYALDLLAHAASLCEMNSESNKSTPTPTNSIYRPPKKNLYFRNEANWVTNSKGLNDYQNSPETEINSSENELNSSINDSKLVIDLGEQQQHQTNSNIQSTETIDSQFNLNLLANLSTLVNLPTPDNSSNDNSSNDSSSNDNSILSVTNTTIELNNTESTKKPTKKSTKQSAKKSSTNNSLIETTTDLSINSRPKRTIKPTQKLKFQLEFEEEIEIEIESRKKATKIPEHLKDDAYLIKRQKNNAAAKKSRDKKNAKIDSVRLSYQINYNENQTLKQEFYNELMLMNLIKNAMNLDPEFKNLIKEKCEENNLNYYDKLIDFKFNEQEIKEGEQQLDEEM